MTDTSSRRMCTSNERERERKGGGREDHGELCLYLRVDSDELCGLKHYS